MLGCKVGWGRRGTEAENTFVNHGRADLGRRDPLNSRLIITWARHFSTKMRIFKDLKMTRESWGCSSVGKHCLACARPWVLSPAPPKKTKRLNSVL
jgi:hypothetical protein